MPTADLPKVRGFSGHLSLAQGEILPSKTKYPFGIQAYEYIIPL